MSLPEPLPSRLPLPCPPSLELRSSCLPAVLGQAPHPGQAPRPGPPGPSVLSVAPMSRGVFCVSGSYTPTKLGLKFSHHVPLSFPQSRCGAVLTMKSTCPVLHFLRGHFQQQNGTLAVSSFQRGLRPGKDEGWSGTVLAIYPHRQGDPLSQVAWDRPSVCRLSQPHY